WEHGQLEDEIDQNSWIVASTQTEQVFNDDHNDFWKDAVKSLGQKYAHIANFPENPQWN
ncbi:MAG: YqgE/AlgH family protein, partial [bacterium]